MEVIFAVNVIMIKKLNLKANERNNINKYTVTLAACDRKEVHVLLCFKEKKM